MKTMGRIAVLISSFVLALSLCACGSSASTSEGNVFMNKDLGVKFDGGSTWTLQQGGTMFLTPEQVESNDVWSATNEAGDILEIAVTKPGSGPDPDSYLEAMIGGVRDSLTAYEGATFTSEPLSVKLNDTELKGTKLAITIDGALLYIGIGIEIKNGRMLMAYVVSDTSSGIDSAFNCFSAL